MPSLQEILAAKKAAQNKVEEPKAEVVVPAVKTIEEPIKKEEVAIAPPKPMSFAEKMALKKQQEAAAKDKTTPPSPAQAAVQLDVGLAPTPAKVDTKTPVVATVIQTPNSVDEKLRTGMLDASLDQNKMPPPDAIKPEDSVDPQVAQAYADIKERIDRLNEMSAGSDLEGEMKNLKKALMSNPAAVSLMEDTDIGKMVIALRKITGEAIAEAAKEKSPGRKKKDKTVDLSDPDVVASVFAEL